MAQAWDCHHCAMSLLTLELSLIIILTLTLCPLLCALGGVLARAVARRTMALPWHCHNAWHGSRRSIVMTVPWACMAVACKSTESVPWHFHRNIEQRGHNCKNLGANLKALRCLQYTYTSPRIRNNVKSIPGFGWEEVSATQRGWISWSNGNVSFCLMEMPAGYLYVTSNPQ